MKNVFPENFLWGASTSAYQVEGGNLNCDWAEWEKSTGHEICGKACDHYSLYESDINIARDLGHNAHRLGLEWSRIETSEGEFDNREWEHYKKVLGSLKEKGLEPFLTIHHFTLPLWLSSKGGWLNPSSPQIFERFAKCAAEKLKDETTYWITINEPNILAVLAYLWGQWPPCHKNFNETVTVLENMLKAHALAYAAIKEEAGESARIGVAKAVTAFHPNSLYSLPDRISAHLRNRFHNNAFISSLIKGQIELTPGKRVPLPVKNSLDFIGINYYFRQFIMNEWISLGKNPFGEVSSPPPRAGERKITDMGWEVYPEGLYETLKAMSSYRIPLIVTENGIATRDDNERKDYIKGHLRAVQRALSENIPIKGYLHWSLLDNFEWDSGYTKKFGLVEVDPITLERKIRPSAKYYSDIIASGMIT